VSVLPLFWRWHAILAVFVVTMVVHCAFATCEVQNVMKKPNWYASDVILKLKMHKKNSFSAGAPGSAPDPLWKLMTLPHAPCRLRREYHFPFPHLDAGVDHSASILGATAASIDSTATFF